MFRNSLSNLKLFRHNLMIFCSFVFVVAMEITMICLFISYQFNFLELLMNLLQCPATL